MDNMGGEGSNRSVDFLEPVLEPVYTDTLKALEAGQKQLALAAENARNECLLLNDALAETDAQLAAVTEQLNQHYNNQIKTACEIGDFQVRLEFLTETKNSLRHKKVELETGLFRLREKAEKAGSMASQLAIAKDFIRGNYRDINVQLDGLTQRQQLGLQIIRAQEEERKRLSREIHDGPAQSLANVVLRMEFCEKLLDVNPEKVRNELGDLKKTVRNNLQDVRKIIFDLRPMALDDLGVIPALKRYIEDFKDKNNLNIVTSFRGGEVRFEPALEVALFRLIQEALNNVVKHARASEAKVTVDVHDNLVKAVVEDDGVGFVLAKALNNPVGARFGLTSMKERADLLGGNIHIETKPGQGTKIMFVIPVS